MLQPLPIAVIGRMLASNFVLKGHVIFSNDGTTLWKSKEKLAKHDAASARIGGTMSGGTGSWPS